MDALESNTNLGRDSILHGIESLLGKGAISVKKSGSKSVQLSSEGKRYLKEFPEEALVKRLRPIKKQKISKIDDQIGLGWAKKNGWISINKDEVSLTPEGTKAAAGKEYLARALLIKLTGPGAGDLIDKNKDLASALSKRNLIEIRDRSVINEVSITKTGAQMLSSAPKEQGIGQLTKEIIKSGEWKKKPLKPYDVGAPTEPSYPARLHPVREFINAVREAWLEMGFIEVQGPLVESAFWNFDALFSPQDHPTREMQDTFFLSNPKQLTIEDLELLDNVKKMHIEGWKEKWSEEIAKSAVLRTHTTSVSARYIRKFAEAAQMSYPAKMFSIGPVFRNESIDYKHLAQFINCDGIVVGDNLTFANLTYVLKSFYSKLGLDDVYIRPAYFPFTEPSLELVYYDKERGASIELAGGGIIRKEITKAMGVDKTVLAWGSGLDRLMLHPGIFGADSLPTLYKNDVAWLRSRKSLKV
jgi:phenylalanyl-tRNA synthetase alpha chain